MFNIEAQGWGSAKAAPLPGPKFKLGQIVATRGAADAFQKTGQIIALFLTRHVTGDWGDLCQDDKALNDEAVANEGNQDKQQRVLSMYHLNDGTRIYIITEWDRSVTTILLPEEY
jgi:hypothetical protein